MIDRMVTFQSEGHTLQAYYARPDSDGPHPGVVVIHEAFGLNDNIRDITRRFAEEGYAALAVDLFAGRNMALCMMRFMGNMIAGNYTHGGIRDLKAALSFFIDQPEVDKDRVGAIGFCMGGGFAIAWAVTDNRLKAIAPFYGMNPRPIDKLAERMCPVVGSYPEQDFTKGAGQKLDAALDQYHIPHDIKIYPDSKHSFFNDTRGNYNAEAARDSWQRVMQFFQQHI
jgi:carboxymethylenebutenolidase